MYPACGCPPHPFCAFKRTAARLCLHVEIEGQDAARRQDSERGFIILTDRSFSDAPVGEYRCPYSGAEYLVQVLLPILIGGPWGRDQIGPDAVLAQHQQGRFIGSCQISTPREAVEGIGLLPCCSGREVMVNRAPEQ